jgi:hypothetical protein
MNTLKYLLTKQKIINYSSFATESCNKLIALSNKIDKKKINLKLKLILSTYFDEIKIF